MYMAWKVYACVAAYYNRAFEKCHSFFFLNYFCITHEIISSCTILIYIRYRSLSIQFSWMKYMYVYVHKIYFYKDKNIFCPFTTVHPLLIIYDLKRGLIYLFIWLENAWMHFALWHSKEGRWNKKGNSRICIPAIRQN